MRNSNTHNAGQGSDRCGDARALLLRHDHEGVRKNPPATHEARSACVLTQSRTGADRPAEATGREPSEQDAAPDGSQEQGLARAAAAKRAFESRTRITCVDRAVIRTYFHPHDKGNLSRRKKGAQCLNNANHANSANKRRNWDGGLLPDDLERHLSQLPAGFYRMLRGSAVLLVEGRTQRVIDAVHGVRHG